MTPPQISTNTVALLIIYAVSNPATLLVSITVLASYPEGELLFPRPPLLSSPGCGAILAC